MEGRNSQIALQALSRRSSVSEMTPGTSSIYGEDVTRAGATHDIHSAAGETHQPHDELPAYSRAAPPGQFAGRGNSAVLHRSGEFPFFTILFLALIMYSWVVLVILSFRPISTHSWEPHTGRYNDYPKNLNYKLDERLYRSARIIQSIASVLVLPWTSAVCAYAAVIFVQNQKDGLSLTMRQVMNLADRRWMDGTIIADIFSGGWKKNGSTFLAVAIFLHFFALLIYPIQSIVISPTTRHVPTFPVEMGQISDLSRMREDQDHILGSDVVQARSAFAKADRHTWQPQLWEEGGHQQFATFKNLSDMNNPFYCPLPNGFNGGVLRQYAPRINSNATVQVVDRSEYARDCEYESANLFARYSSVYTRNPGGTYENNRTWEISACMMSTSTGSPWVETRDRQEFSETLYINVTNPDIDYSLSPLANGTLYKINLRTIAGYFELPNYMNNQTASPLFFSDPTGGCEEGGYGCVRQAARYYYNPSRQVKRQSDDTDNSTITTDETLPWKHMMTARKGPLMTTALAIFGPGSFLNTFFAEYDSMKRKLIDANISSGDIDYSRANSLCIELAPLMNMYSASGLSYVGTDSCISSYFSEIGNYYYSSNPHDLVARWLDSMFNDREVLKNTFDAAAFLVNKRFVEALYPTFDIYQDLGAEIGAPESTVAGIIVATIFLGLWIIPLIALAFYGSVNPRWTSRLDSFAMLRFGAFYGSGIFPMLVSRKTKNIKELDEVSGVVRDAGTVNDDPIIPVGRVGLGEGKPLRRSRRYECYKGDSEPLTPSELSKIRRGG